MLACPSYDPHLDIFDYAPHKAAAVPVMCQLSGPVVIRSSHHESVLAAHRRRPPISPSAERVLTELRIQASIHPMRSVIERDFHLPDASSVVKRHALHFVGAAHNNLF